MGHLRWFARRRPWRSIALILAAAALFAAAPPSVRAQGAGASDPEAERAAMARALFTEGVELARQESFAQAADLFRRAHRLRPAPAIAYNLAMALVRLEEIVEATELLRWVIRHEETPAGMAEASRGLLDDVAGRVAQLRLDLDGPVDGVELQLDERPLSLEVVGVSVPIDPGAHELTASRAGDEVARERFEVADGGQHALRLTIPAAAVPEPVVEDTPPAVEPAPAGDDLSWLLWTSLAVLVVGAGVAITAVLLTQPQPEAEPVSGTTIPPVLEWD